MKKKVGVGGLESDDIRKISEMLTDDPDVFVEEGMPMEPMGGMEGGDAPPPPMGGAPADDMAPEGDVMPEEEGGQWAIMMHGAENKVWGPYGSREEAVADMKECLQAEHPELVAQADSGTVTGDGFTKMVVPLESSAKEEEAMVGDEIGGEDLPPMGGGEEPLGGAPPPADAAGGVPPTEDMMGGY